MIQARKIAAEAFEVAAYGLLALSAVLVPSHAALSVVAALGAGGAKLASRAVKSRRRPPPARLA